MPTRGGAEQANTATDTTAKTVRKNNFEEKFLAYLDKIDPTLKDKLFEVETRKFSDGDNKNDIAFAIFSGNGKKDTTPNDAENVSIIKDILFKYHTSPDTGNPFSFVLQVLPPEDEATDVHALVFQVALD